MTKIEVVGPGCRRCEELERTVREVLAGSGLDAQVRRVTDPTEIVARGFFMRTPGLVIDDAVVATGRVPHRREIASWIGVPDDDPRGARGLRRLFHR